MFYRVRAFLLSLTIIAVLVFSAVGTTVVYADGGTTSDTPPAETSDGSEQGGEPEDVDEAEEPAGESEKPGPDTVDTIETVEPTDTAPTEVPVDEGVPAEGEATPVPTEEVAPPAEGEATPVPTEEEVAPPAEETAPETTPAEKPAVDAPILDSVPENTTVTVLNAEGEAQPLATEAAAEAIATSDPIWCPAGQSPTPGANGCTQSFNSFTALLTFLAGNATYSGAGTIYVEQGNYQGGESTVDFNNFNLTNISSSDLTITGGWDTSTGTTTSTSTFNNVSIIIGTSTNPWGGSLTLNNITITNPANTGIVLNSQTNVNLSNVNVTNSTNGAGAEITAGNDVNINNSKFERNKTAGAIIRATRDVSIANSSFSNPATARRQIVGLDIITDGSVSLLNVLANENRQVGTVIDAGGRVSIANSGFSGTKAIVGSDFLGYGLKVTSDSAIDLAFVTANDNFLWGAWLIAAGDVAIADSVFNLNTTEDPGFIDDTGLLVTSGGNVSIINSQANENRLIGATIEAVGDVSISNSQFNSNNGITQDSSGNPTFHGYGLQVITDGNIFLDGVTASDNTLFGARLESGLDVLVTNSTFSNNTSGTEPGNPVVGRGLEVVTTGNVLMENVTLSNNQTFGANIQAGGAVFLDTITATGNGTNGVEVEATCTDVFLMDGTYTDNGGYGLSVINGNLTQSGAPVFANNVAGNIFNDPGTCVFAPPTTPTTPTNPPVYKPNDVGPVVPVIPGVTALGKAVSFSGESLSAPSAAGMVSLNSFLAGHGMTYSNTHIGVFTGKYAYVYLSSGMQIVAYTPSPANELAVNGS